MTVEHWLAEAIDLATTNVTRGGGPFGALVIRGTEVIARGVNRVTADLDPTAHAEVVAIRTACQTLGDFRLHGCTLVSSCEPCPLCLSASLWSRLDRVVFAADRDDAAKAGFADSEFYDVLARPRDTWPLKVDQLRPGTESTPFTAWTTRLDRTDY
ncbi:nucleoside deaminase [Actinokineospora cianjurensis]|uniref:tRNA(Arg) A34 adenosine deaminase TadA n=1 Tax=Actinokineospora cianjurensis TaxID=585224 RepID=A0A421B4K5_9PSEU|nr:nucleoside deaminase [Actinokineospora cianjurensis]RLK59213.1 tRNA(Arg) A34 adenosine deaminase TadA [Actinokineospora cianjurensis]